MRNGFRLPAAACLGAIVLLGCEDRMARKDAATAAQEVRQDPAMRTVVPLVRYLGPDVLSKPIVLEFDIPAFPEDTDQANSAIFIGVRVASHDQASAWDKAYRLQSAKIAANVHMYRLKGAVAQPLDLKRHHQVGTGKSHVVHLNDAGHVPELRFTSTDYPTLQAAGLLNASIEYCELGWAYEHPISPGRYRLNIRIDDHDEALQREDSELLVAFSHRAK